MVWWVHELLAKMSFLTGLTWRVCVSHLETRMWKIDLISESKRCLNLKDIEVRYNETPIRK